MSKALQFQLLHQMHVTRKCGTQCWKEESLLHQSVREKKSRLTFFIEEGGTFASSMLSISLNTLNGQLASANKFIACTVQILSSLVVNFTEGFIAGGTAGVVVETALYPIDTIKTRLQAGFSFLQNFLTKAARGGGKINLQGLYSGLAGNLAGVLPASAVFVGVYEPTKQKLLKLFPENLSAAAHLTAGAVGGMAASLIRVPTEVIKQRMQTGQFTSAPDAVRLIVSKEGFKGLYAGYGSFLLRDLPFDALQFCIYEQLRIGYKAAAQRDLNDPENAIIGAFAESEMLKA
ncbi:s-adenosylmethionine carrier 1 [Quercus suber]|uniref:S-adenosylmethionine carrier 1 n=2 Tax=Quercus suber TaxID=58331 RepID=A0AAW0M708_QUESU